MVHEVRSMSSARTPAWTAADMTFSDISIALNSHVTLEIRIEISLTDLEHAAGGCRCDNWPQSM